MVEDIEVLYKRITTSCLGACSHISRRGSGKEGRRTIIWKKDCVVEAAQVRSSVRIGHFGGDSSRNNSKTERGESEQEKRHIEGALRKEHRR